VNLEAVQAQEAFKALLSQQLALHNEMSVAYERVVMALRQEVLLARVARSGEKELPKFDSEASDEQQHGPFPTLLTSSPPPTEVTSEDQILARKRGQAHQRMSARQHRPKAKVDCKIKYASAPPDIERGPAQMQAPVKFTSMMQRQVSEDSPKQFQESDGELISVLPGSCRAGRSTGVDPGNPCGSSTRRPGRIYTVDGSLESLSLERRPLGLERRPFRCHSFSSGSASLPGSPRRPSITRSCSSASSFNTPRSGMRRDYFEMWPCWEYVRLCGDSPDLDSDADMQARREKTVSKVMEGFSSIDESVPEIFEWRAIVFLQMLVLHPNCIKRLSWVALSMIFITFDMLTTPLYVFGIQDSRVVVVMTWAGILFWLLDLPASLLTGYYIRTTVEMNVSKTAGHYARTWMLFDVALIITDLLVATTMWPRGASVLRGSKLLRSARALRSLRMLRVVRLPISIRDFICTFGHSEYAWLTLSLASHMFGILLINHFIACFWYFIGCSGDGWVDEYVKGEPVEMLYFTALHWSLTQFTPATMAVQPQNFSERVFAVAVLLFAMIVFSAFVSSITNLMTNLFNLNSAEMKQFMRLDRYLHDNNISFRLSVRIRRYLEHLHLEKQRNLQERDVEPLVKLSQPLQMELRYEVHYPLLSKHPFFLYFALTNLPVVQRVCLEALQCVLLCAGDALFGPGDTAWAMYFISRGVLMYQKQGERLPAALKSCQWFCESVLWTPWEHKGEMRAVTAAKLLALDAEKFQTMVCRNQAAALQPAGYATEAVERLNSCKKAELTDVDSTLLDYEGMARNCFAVRDDEHEGAISTAKAWFTKKVNRVSTRESFRRPSLTALA